MNVWVQQLLFIILLMCSSLCPLLAFSVPTEQTTISKSPQLDLTPSIQTGHIEWAYIVDKERFAVTDYNTKSIMVWDLQTGTKLKLIQLAVIDGDGHMSGVEISPDGDTIAVVWRLYDNDQKFIYIFDRKSGQLLQRISGFEEADLHLNYARDGSHLAVAIGEDDGFLNFFSDRKNGLNIYRSSDYQEVFADRDYYSKPYCADFDSTGRRLATISKGGLVRLYQLSSSQWQLIKTYNTDKNTTCLTFSSDNQHLIVDFYGKEKSDILLLTSDKLQPIFVSEAQKLKDYTVISDVDPQQSDKQREIVKYHLKRRHYSRFSLYGRREVVEIFPLSNGDSMVFYSDGLARLTKDGKILWHNLQPRVDFHIFSYQAISRSNIRLSLDGSRILFHMGPRSKRLATFDLRSQKMIVTGGRSSSVLPSWAGTLNVVRINSPGVQITDWNSQGFSDWNSRGNSMLNGYSPKLNGHRLEIIKYENSESLAIAPGNNPQSFVLGTSSFLRKFDLQKGQLLWKKNLYNNKALSVAISGDRRWLVAGLDDGTLRWYNYADGKEQLALYPHTNGIDWLLWTPKGFFSSSSLEANDLFGFNIVNDGEQTSDFIKVDQLYESFYRPDLVLAQFEGGSSLLEHSLNNIGNLRQALQLRPPKLELVDPLPKSIDGTQLTVKLRIIDQGGGIGNIKVKVNKLPQKARAAMIDVSSSPSSEKIINLTLVIPTGKSSLEFYSASAVRSGQKGVINSQPLIAEVFSTVKPKLGSSSLTGLAVGIDKYLDQALHLKYAVNDVSSLLHVLKDNSSPLFSNFDIQSVTDKQATKQGIVDAFEAAISTTKENDVFLFYLSGHGKVINGEYYFLPRDLIYTDIQSLMRNSLSQDELAELLSKVPARKSLIIIDTCYAGSFKPEMQLASSTSRDINDKTALDRLIHATGRTIFYASSDKKVALEGYKGHGLFTGVLLDGLKGAANYVEDNYIDTTELELYLSHHVPVVSKDKFGVSSKPWVNKQGNTFRIIQYTQ